MLNCSVSLIRHQVPNLWQNHSGSRSFPPLKKCFREETSRMLQLSARQTKPTQRYREICSRLELMSSLRNRSQLQCKMAETWSTVLKAVVKNFLWAITAGSIHTSFLQSKPWRMVSLGSQSQYLVFGFCTNLLAITCLQQIGEQSVMAEVLSG